jgi:spore coat polysaccharide biosynthesis protein SpsF
MKKAIFITVRAGSSRLPNKATLEINGKPTIELLIERAKQSKMTDMIILCTSTEPGDEVLCDIASRCGINSFRGSLLDKVDRWRAAAEHYNIDYFVNIDGDDLLCEPELIDMAFRQYHVDEHDFVKVDDTNIVCGAFTLGAKTEAIQEVCRLKTTTDTEALWLSFSSIPSFNTVMLENVPNIFYRPEIRATLDYKEDLDFFDAIFSHFKRTNNKDFSLRDVVEFIDENPKIVQINRHRHQDYLDNQKKLNKTL